MSPRNEALRHQGRARGEGPQGAPRLEHARHSRVDPPLVGVINRDTWDARSSLAASTPSLGSSSHPRPTPPADPPARVALRSAIGGTPALVHARNHGTHGQSLRRECCEPRVIRAGDALSTAMMDKATKGIGSAPPVGTVVTAVLTPSPPLAAFTGVLCGLLGLAAGLMAAVSKGKGVRLIITGAGTSQEVRDRDAEAAFERRKAHLVDRSLPPLPTDAGHSYAHAPMSARAKSTWVEPDGYLYLLQRGQAKHCLQKGRRCSLPKSFGGFKNNLMLNGVVSPGIRLMA